MNKQQEYIKKSLEQLYRKTTMQKVLEEVMPYVALLILIDVMAVCFYFIGKAGGVI